MTNLTDWANKWNIPQEAVTDLMNNLRGIDSTSPPDTSAGHEAYVQQAVRLEASSKGCRLWRNNVGAVQTDDGRHIRYGLCNESKRVNEKIKSSDLIGICPVLVKPEHVGRTHGIFLAREVKRESWQYSHTKREQAQLNFLNLVLSLGGDSAFAKGIGTL